jgi:flagellar biosynthesis component FlhA
LKSKWKILDKLKKKKREKNEGSKRQKNEAERNKKERQQHLVPRAAKVKTHLCRKESRIEPRRRLPARYDIISGEAMQELGRVAPLHRNQAPAGELRRLIEP